MNVFTNNTDAKGAAPTSSRQGVLQAMRRSDSQLHQRVDTKTMTATFYLAFACLHMDGRQIRLGSYKVLDYVHLGAWETYHNDTGH